MSQPPPIPHVYAGASPASSAQVLRDVAGRALADPLALVGVAGAALRGLVARDRGGTALERALAPLQAHAADLAHRAPTPQDRALAQTAVAAAFRLATPAAGGPLRPGSLPRRWGRRLVQSGGAALGIGALQLARDMLPVAADAAAERARAAVGVQVATTPGAVVLDHPRFELLHYRAATPRVHARPVLLAPPPLGRHWLLDLEPGRSLVRHLVANGLQVFVISWADAQPGDGWDLAATVSALDVALDAACAITRSADGHVAGFGSGVTLTAALAGHLAARQDRRIAGLSLLGGAIRAGRDDPRLGCGGAAPGDAVVDWRDLARAHAADDVERLAADFERRYVLAQPDDGDSASLWAGAPAPAPGALLREMLDLVRDDALARATLTLLNTPIDLGRVTAEIYILAAAADPLAPPAAVLGSADLFGGAVSRALVPAAATGGLLCGPAVAERACLDNPGEPPGAAAWQDGARTRPWSWWDHWTDWLCARGAGTRRAPVVPGSPDFAPLRPAPGRNASA
ncbi:hypothetical protein [Zavarzinia sp. CC-PAN008]|uniref:hypothetical protein n=1 Tax=Zavarzinia sp. CC-PAN008 TaxID=3243332 RepID=UPI003F7444BC